MTKDQINHIKATFLNNNLFSEDQVNAISYVLSFFEAAAFEVIKASNDEWIREAVKKEINKYLFDLVKISEKIKTLSKSIYISLPEKEVDKISSLILDAKEQLKSLECDAEEIKNNMCDKLKIIYSMVDKEPEPDFDSINHGVIIEDKPKKMEKKK